MDLASAQDGAARANRMLGQDVSVRRVIGFACDRLWVFLMFYSIVPFANLADVRESLYLHQFISTVAMAAALVVVALVAQRQARLSANRGLVIAGAAAMTLGSMLALFAQPQTSTGVLLLGVSGLMTGIGSAVVLVGWLEAMAREGMRLGIVEFALASCAAFLAGLLLVNAPAVLGIGCAVAAPVASGALLLIDSKDLPRWVKMPPYRAPSRSTTLLFVKALVGVLAFGMLEGFFDAFTGYGVFAVQDFHGVNLFLWGFAAMLAVGVIGVFNRNDALFYAYRLAMMLMCVGCLTTLYASDTNTLSGGVVFAGYAVLVVVLFAVCANVSSSFGIGLARALACGFAALYAGELLGAGLVMAADDAALTGLLGTVIIIAVAWLFFANLFLFTETDLIKIGIGELEFEPAPEPEAAPADDAPAAPEPSPHEAAERRQELLCAEIVKRYGLSPREADVLPLLLQGRTIARIQETLYISAGTVSTHIRHIYQKTGAQNRQSLLDLAEEIGRTADEA